MEINQLDRDTLLSLAKKKVYLEGNILKLLQPSPEDKEFINYIKLCQEKDTTNRRKRMVVAKEVQAQNKELIAKQKENDSLMKDLQIALSESTKLKEEAEKGMGQALEDLELMQRKSQFELIGTIVKVALFIICGVGLTTTLMYGIAIWADKDTQIIGSAWSNLFGILLTNAFSIVGTIMGVKYATDKQ